MEVLENLDHPWSGGTFRITLRATWMLTCRVGTGSFPLLICQMMFQYFQQENWKGQVYMILHTGKFWLRTCFFFLGWNSHAM